jgi:hypothetical protein
MSAILVISAPDMVKSILFDTSHTKWLSYGYLDGAHGSVEVEALCYKREGRGFVTRYGQLIFFNLPNASGRTRP